MKRTFYGDVTVCGCVQSALGLWRLHLTLSRFPGSRGLFEGLRRGGGGGWWGVAPRGQLCVTHIEQMFLCICRGRVLGRRLCPDPDP